MAVNKGLKSLAESTHNFSNQALENAINELKIGWASKSIALDTEIEDNTVLTLSQKNDLKETINNVAYLNVGRYLGDIVRHTNKGVGIVQLIDGVAVWVLWAGGELNHSSSFSLEILDKAA